MLPEKRKPGRLLLNPVSQISPTEQTMQAQDQVRAPHDIADQATTQMPVAFPDNQQEQKVPQTPVIFTDIPFEQEISQKSINVIGDMEEQETAQLPVAFADALLEQEITSIPPSVTDAFDEQPTAHLPATAADALENQPTAHLPTTSTDAFDEQPTAHLPATSTDALENQPTAHLPATATDSPHGQGDAPSEKQLPKSSVSTSKLIQREHRKRKTRKKRLPLWLAACSIITIITVVFVSQGNGTTGAWLADALRAVVGPTITANIESWYLGLSNTSSQVQYQLSNKKVAAPWKAPSVKPTPTPTPPAWSTLSSMTLPAMSAAITPALPGEGTWNVLDNAPAPYNYLPLDARAFIRPDPVHPYAIVTMLQFDPRFTLLHIAAGTVEPGGPRGMRGPGVISTVDVQGNSLLAAFNGGFKYADGQYGLMTNGTVYVPPQSGSATIAVTKEGKLILGAWGVDPQLSSQNTDLVAWRQNAALLIDKGVINPLTQDGAAWGGTVLNSSYTWRSGIGITAQGTLIYAAGNALTALTLGEAMKSAGAVMAMQTDINPFWVRAFLYHRTQAQISVEKLNPQMQGNGYEYLNGTQRDFFYLTRFAPATPPSNKILGSGS